MTINGDIAVVNHLIGLLSLIVGAVFAWQAKGRIWTGWRPVWPVSVWVAIAGPFLLGGATWMQVATFRYGAVPPPFGPNDWGTLGLRVCFLWVLGAVLYRVQRRRLFNADDLDRLRHRSG